MSLFSQTTQYVNLWTLGTNCKLVSNTTKPINLPPPLFILSTHNLLTLWPHHKKHDCLECSFPFHQTMHIFNPNHISEIKSITLLSERAYCLRWEAEAVYKNVNCHRDTVDWKLEVRNFRNDLGLRLVLVIWTSRGEGQAETMKKI